MASTHEYWVISLPTGKRLKGEETIDSINRELTELVERGWDVAAFDRSSAIGPATFVLKKAK